jgi:hypothetical protein
MPSTFQSPLERHRDVERRWSRLLEQTFAPAKHDTAIFTMLPPAHHSHAEAESVQVTELRQPRRVEWSPPTGANKSRGAWTDASVPVKCKRIGKASPGSVGQTLKRG